MSSTVIRNHLQGRRGLKDVQVPVRLKLSALWAAAMFLYVYVDIFAMYRPGTIDGILVGRVWEFDITQAWALGALVLMPARFTRWSNVVVASLYVLVSIGNALGETWAFYWFGLAVEAMLLLAVIWYAWTWPHQID